MNITILTLANMAAALVVFFYASNRLSAKKWTFRQPELWVHTLLVGSSLAVFLTSVWDVGHRETAETFFNITTATYLGVRAWRKVHHKPPTLPFPKFIPSKIINQIKGKKS